MYAPFENQHDSHHTTDQENDGEEWEDDEIFEASIFGLVHKAING
jgi:hypothetical protein